MGESTHAEQGRRLAVNGQALEDRLLALGYVYASYLGKGENSPPYKALRESFREAGFVQGVYELAGRPDKRVVVLYANEPDQTGSHQLAVFQDKDAGGVWQTVLQQSGALAVHASDAEMARGPVNAAMARFAVRLRSFQPSGCRFSLQSQTDLPHQQVFSGFTHVSGRSLGDELRLRLVLESDSADPVVLVDKRNFASCEWIFVHRTTVSRLCDDPVYTNDIDLASIPSDAEKSAPAKEGLFAWLRRQI